MTTKNIKSFTSSPFPEDKENLCPNKMTNTVFVRSKVAQKVKGDTPSMRSEPDFNMFKTINLPRISQQQSLTTKSRAEMEAIL